MSQIGQLVPVKIQEQWPGEAQHFTPWLAEAENLQLLADTIGIPLELEGTEQPVGRYIADIVGIEGGAADDRRVVIENQYGRSDHSHLGQILTYVAGKEAYTAVWIAESFTDEHRAAIDWLNQHTDQSKAFWALEIELWRIGDSLPAPRFNVVGAPNPVKKEAERATGALSDVRRDRLQFWQAFETYLSEQRPDLWMSKPQPETWTNHSVGTSGVHFAFIYSNFDLETQKFLDHDVSRVELLLTGSLAFERYKHLTDRSEEIESAVGEMPLVWYDRASKERKIFTQQHWTQGAESDRELMFAWLADRLDRMKEVFLPHLLD